MHLQPVVYLPLSSYMELDVSDIDILSFPSLFLSTVIPMSLEQVFWISALRTCFLITSETRLLCLALWASQVSSLNRLMALHSYQVTYAFQGCLRPIRSVPSFFQCVNYSTDER